MEQIREVVLVCGWFVGFQFIVVFVDYKQEREVEGFWRVEVECF